MDNKRVLVLIALALAACALFVPLLRADEPATQPADASAITAWDGSTDKGSGWTTPKSDKISLTADGEGYKGKKSVQFKASASGFIAFGWNWIGWYPPGAGTDASAADRVRFYVKLTGDAKPHDFNIHLSSANGKPSKDVQLSKNATEKGADITDGNWHEIAIPMKDLANADFGPKAVRELDMSQWSGDNVNFTLLIDSIQFLPADAK
jgi:hypothetical protein